MNAFALNNEKDGSKTPEMSIPIRFSELEFGFRYVYEHNIVNKKHIFSRKLVSSTWFGMSNLFKIFSFRQALFARI